MQNWRLYFTVLLIFLISWVPSSLEFSLQLHSQGNLALGRVADMLLLLPFIVASVVGFVYGREIILKIGLIASVAAFASFGVFYWDLQTVSGGWRVYGPDLSSMVLLFALLVGGTVIVAYFGRLLKAITQKLF